MTPTGMPDIADVLAKLGYTAPDVLPAETDTEAKKILAAVIAQFQSPPGLHGQGGGTGRRFEPVQATRLYDGNGYSELRVDDIVPGSALQVASFGSVYPDVMVQESGFGRGWNMLVRPQSAGAILGVSYGLAGVFPIGLQNISVSTTFGFAAQVPADVFEAITAETCYRMLIEGFIGLDGVGDTLKIGTFEVDTSAMSDNWKISATPPLLHQTFTDCVSVYRDRGLDRWKRLAASKRMS